MSFYDKVARAKLLLTEQGRVSGLMREFGLDKPGVEELVEELVDVQGAALRTGNVLVATGHPSSEAAAAAPQSPAAQIEPRASTPQHLADKILQSKSALEGERKQVTVLFADVKGSMDIAEQLDAEEWSASAQGHTVGLAQRMESLASPDTCLVSANTAVLMRGYFDLQPLHVEAEEPQQEDDRKRNTDHPEKRAARQTAFRVLLGFIHGETLLFSAGVKTCSSPCDSRSNG